MKKTSFMLSLITTILIIFSSLAFTTGKVDVKDYIEGKFPSIFAFYLSSLEDLDSDEKEFIDILEGLSQEHQKYYAKEVYNKGFSKNLLQAIKGSQKNDKSKYDWSEILKLHLSDEQVADKLPESLPSIIKKIAPSTVIIYAYDDVGDFLQLGSGFFLTKEGGIITNYHVIEDAAYAEIITADDKTYPITYILAEDEQNDIILLSADIPSQYVSPLSLSNKTPEVGERVIVYGSPLGLAKTVSDGIISAIRVIPDYGEIIQMTAPISPGSSGSPVLNMKGEVIGIATFQLIKGQNLNFAIPSEKIAKLVFKEHREITFTKEPDSQETKIDKDFDYQQVADDAYYFIEREKYEKALPYLSIVTQTKDSYLKSWAYFYIGYCYDELGNYTKAIDAYKQSIRLDPDVVSAYYNLGLIYYNLKRYEDAVEAYKHAIRLDSDYADAYYNLGNVYYKLKRYEDAVNAYKQSIRLDSDYADAYYNLGIVYYDLDMYQDAIDAYKQSIRLDPDYADAYYNLGNVYYVLDMYQDAIDAYKQSIRLDPGDAHAYYMLGLTYYEVGDVGSTLYQYRILEKLDIELANELFEYVY